MKCKHILAELLYCVVIPLLSSISLLTLEHSASWLHTYLWSCRSSKETKNKSRKMCCFFFVFGFFLRSAVCFFLATVELMVAHWLVFKCTVLLCCVFLHCVWHVWKLDLLFDHWHCICLGFLLAESRDREQGFNSQLRRHSCFMWNFNVSLVVKSVVSQCAVHVPWQNTMWRLGSFCF